MQAKSKLVVVFTVLVLSGCISDLNKARSDYVCKDRGGVYTYGTLGAKAVCNDGSNLNLPKVVPDEKFWVKSEKPHVK